MSHLSRAQPDAAPRPYLFVGMPAYAGVTPQTVGSLLELTAAARARGIRCDVQILPGVSLLEHARAILADLFLMGADYTHWLMVDADMSFAPDVVLRMLEADVDLIGVSAPKKNLDLDKVREAVLAGRSDWRTAGMDITADLGERVEITRGAARVPTGGVGTGLLLARRAVIQRVHDAHPELMYTVDGRRLSLMFRSGIRDGEYIGEDIGFSRFWRELGGEIHLLLDADIGHHGSFCFRGNLEVKYNAPIDSRAITGCRSAACRTLDSCLCSCERCATDCVGRESAPVAPPVDDMIASLQRIAAMEDA